MISENELKKFIKEARKFYMTTTDTADTVYYKEIEKGLYFVMGFGNGFDEDKNDKLSYETWHLSGKLAYNSDIMQCDYGWDWSMPFDVETGEVYDTDHPIYTSDRVDSLARYYLNEAKEILKEIEAGTLTYDI